MKSGPSSVGWPEQVAAGALVSLILALLGHVRRAGMAVLENGGLVEPVEAEEVALADHLARGSVLDGHHPRHVDGDAQSLDQARLLRGIEVAHEQLRLLHEEAEQLHHLGAVFLQVSLQRLREDRLQQHAHPDTADAAQMRSVEEILHPRAHHPHQNVVHLQGPRSHHPRSEHDDVHHSSDVLGCRRLGRHHLDLPSCMPWQHHWADGVDNVRIHFQFQFGDSELPVNRAGVQLQKFVYLVLHDRQVNIDEDIEERVHVEQVIVHGQPLDLASVSSDLARTEHSGFPHSDVFFSIIAQRHGNGRDFVWLWIRSGVNDLKVDLPSVVGEVCASVEKM
eukprot:422884-Rhodomonas_salina.2